MQIKTATAEPQLQSWKLELFMLPQAAQAKEKKASQMYFEARVVYE